VKQKWENISVSISGGGPTAVNDSLNKMGEEGWEAWDIQWLPDRAIVFFKRPKSAILAPRFSTMPNGSSA
jgi:hypothetical protein